MFHLDNIQWYLVKNNEDPEQVMVIMIILFKFPINIMLFVYMIFLISMENYQQKNNYGYKNKDLNIFSIDNLHDKCSNSFLRIYYLVCSNSQFLIFRKSKLIMMLFCILVIAVELYLSNLLKRFTLFYWHFSILTFNLLLETF